MFEVHTVWKKNDLQKRYWSEQLEQKQVPNGTGQGVRWSKRTFCRHAAPVADVPWTFLKAFYIYTFIFTLTFPMVPLGKIHQLKNIRI